MEFYLNSIFGGCLNINNVNQPSQSFFFNFEELGNWKTLLTFQSLIRICPIIFCAINVEFPHYCSITMIFILGTSSLGRR